jgi:hypothetical protein
VSWAFPGDWQSVESEVAEHVGPLGAALASGAATIEAATAIASTEVRNTFLLSMTTPLQDSFRVNGSRIAGGPGVVIDAGHQSR